MPHKGDMMTVREIVETLGLAADEDAVRKMAEYNAMVIAMSRKMNLTGIKDAEESLVKNIYDSLTVYEEKYFPKNGRMLDLGTGAGFPGIPLAILRPDMQVVLVDSVLKKLVFIENAAAKLGIKNIKILHIRAEEDKLPAVLLLLMLDPLLDLRRRILAAGVLLSVLDDDKEHLLRTVVLRRLLLHRTDLLNRTPDRIEESRAAAREILLGGERGHVRNLHAVMDHIDHIVEQERRDDDIRPLLPVPREHTVEPADGVTLEPRHRPAAIQNEDQLRLSLYFFLCHDMFLLYTRLTFSIVQSIAGGAGRVVA